MYLNFQAFFSLLQDLKPEKFRFYHIAIGRIGLFGRASDKKCKKNYYSYTQKILNTIWFTIRKSFWNRTHVRLTMFYILGFYILRFYFFKTFLYRNFIFSLLKINWILQAISEVINRNIIKISRLSNETTCCFLFKWQ